MKIKLLLVVFLSLFFITRIEANEEKRVVRVGISNQNFSTYEHTNTKLSSNDFVKIIDLSNNSIIEPIEPLKTIEVMMDNSLSI